MVTQEAEATTQIPSVSSLLGNSLCFPSLMERKLMTLNSLKSFLTQLWLLSLTTSVFTRASRSSMWPLRSKLMAVA